MKQIKKLFVLITLALVFAFIGGEMNATTTYAAAMTNKSVKKEIKNIKARNKKLQKQYKEKLAKENKQKKGTVSVLGTIISRNPLIVRDDINGSVYWINKPENFTKIFSSGHGYVKLSNTYRNYGTYTCAVCTAVKVSNDSAKIKDKIDNNQELIKAYERILKDRVIFRDDVIYFTEGGEYHGYEFDYYLPYETDEYNGITLKSSDANIVWFDSNGTVFAGAPGKTTLTATTSIGKKSSKLKVVVLPAYESIGITDVDTIDGVTRIHIAEKENHHVTNIIAMSTNESVVSNNDIFDDGSHVYFTAKNPGTTDIEIYANHILTQTVAITVGEDGGITADFDEYKGEDDI